MIITSQSESKMQQLFHLGYACALVTLHCIRRSRSKTSDATMAAPYEIRPFNLHIITCPPHTSNYLILNSFSDLTIILVNSWILAHSRTCGCLSLAFRNELAVLLPLRKRKHTPDCRSFIQAVRTN